MNIVEKKWDWKTELKQRTSTEWLIYHHAGAVRYSAEEVHRLHQNQNGWAGIGYHFYCTKDGKITTGRPINTEGAHCKGHNHYSIGVCFEGNFDIEEMNDVQLKSGQELTQMIKELYPDIKTIVHGKASGQNTSCAGMNFPFDKLTEHTAKWTKETGIIELHKAGILQDKDGWLKKLDEPMSVWAITTLLNEMYKKLK